MNAVVRRRGSLACGDHAFWEGDAFESLYVVRSGAIKTFTIDADGNERVRGFHLTGDLVGLDAVHPHRHPCSAECLVETQICELPYARLEQAEQQVPALRRNLFELMSRELALALAMSGDFTAEQRIAAFLLDLATRQGRSAGDQVSQVQLDMSRRDIANYLRLVTETVSRVLTRLRSLGLIDVERRNIRLLDLPALRRMAGPLDSHRYDTAAKTEAAQAGLAARLAA